MLFAVVNREKQAINMHDACSAVDFTLTQPTLPHHLQSTNLMAIEKLYIAEVKNNSHKTQLLEPVASAESEIVRKNKR